MQVCGNISVIRPVVNQSSGEVGFLVRGAINGLVLGQQRETGYNVKLSMTLHTNPHQLQNHSLPLKQKPYLLDSPYTMCITANLCQYWPRHIHRTLLSHSRMAAAIEIEFLCPNEHHTVVWSEVAQSVSHQSGVEEEAIWRG